MKDLNLDTYFASQEISTTNNALNVLSLVSSASPLGKHLINIFENNTGAFDVIDLENDIDEAWKLQEAFEREGILEDIKPITQQSGNNIRVLLLRGFVPPAIEIYKGTSSFRPASFRPDGYPGTETWLMQFD